MLFLVVCVFDEGVYEDDFRVVEAPSRLAVAQHILENPGVWWTFLDRSRLYDPLIRGNASYYEEPRPVTAEEAMTIIDNSHVDGDSRARLSIWPITEILTLLPSRLQETTGDTIQR